MPNDQKSIKPNATRKQNLDNKPIKKVGDGTMGFMLWSIAGTVLASCSSPIFSDVADLAGGGGSSGDTQGGPTRAVTNGRWANTEIFLAGEDGARVSGSDAVGITDGAGNIIFNDEYIDLGTLGNGERYIADLDGATEISTPRQGTSGEELLSLPYNGGDLIISPLTDLLARAYIESGPQDMTREQFQQVTLDAILGQRPQFDANGDAFTGTESSIVTVEDVLNVDNYNPFADNNIAAELVSLASTTLGLIEEEASSSTTAQRVEALTNSFDDIRGQLMTEANEDDLSFMLDSDSSIGSIDLDARVADRIANANSRPVVGNPNEGTPIRMTEDEDFVLSRANSNPVLLFGFEDPFDNDVDGQPGGEREPGQLVGIYIEAASMGGDIAVMFGDATNNVALAGADRVADSDSAIPATMTVGGVTFYFVSEANLDQLVLSPETDVSGDFEIRFYVHDGEDVTAVTESNGDLLGVGVLRIAVAPVNDAPELTVVVTDGAVTEAGGTDNNAAGDVMANGRLTITDPDTGHEAFDFTGNTLQGRSGTSGAFTNAVTGTDAVIVGVYGTLTLSATGTWSYALRDDDSDTQALDGGDTVQDVFEIQLVNVDGTTQTSAIVPITIDVTGADDATTITSPASDFGPFDVVDPSRPGTDDAPTATGTFSASDPDDDITWSATATGANSGLGTVTFVGNRWTFTLTDPAGVRALNDLASGDTTDITFDITANDMDAGRDLTITLRGAADVTIPAPVINAFTGNIADADPASDTNRPDPVSGNFSAASGSGTVDRWMAVPRAGAIEYGTIEVTGAQWTFTLNNVGRDEINRLDATDAPAQVIFDVTATNTGGSDTATLTIMLQGINDAPELAAIVTDGAVTEAGDDGDTAANGSLTITDPDTGHEAFDFVGNTLQGRTGTSGAFTNAVTGTDAVIVGVYGTLTLSATGTWSYMLDDSDTDTQGLGAAQTEEDVFQIQLVNVDGTGQGSMQTSAPETITITVTGANDDPVIDSTRVANLEISAVPGSLEVIRMFLSDDDDAGDTAAWSVASRPNNEATYGRFEVDSNTGLGTFTFTGTGETAFNALSSSVTLTYTVMVTDGSGGTDDESFDIVLQAGADNSPVLGESPNPVKTAIEAGHEVAGTAAMGSFTHTDTDAGQGGFVGGTVHIKTDSSAYADGQGRDDAGNVIDGTDRGTPVTGTYGIIYLRADGDWYYVLDNANTDVNALPAGASALEDVFDVRIQETVDSTIVSNVLRLEIMVAGTNDRPTDITASSTTATYNGNEPTADMLVATLTTSDPDTGDAHTYSITGGVDRTVFQIGGANRDQLLFASGVTEADNRNPGSTWSVDITSRDSGGLDVTQTFTIERAGNAFPVFDTEASTDYDATNSRFTKDVTDDNMNPDPDMDSPTATGTIVATDADGGTVTLSARQSGGTEDLGNVGFNGNVWTFALLPAGVIALNALGGGATEILTFEITASDGSGTDTTTLRITLKGAANVAIPAPDIDTPNSGLVGTIMDDDASAHDNTPTPAAMGAITLTPGTNISGLMWSVASASVSGLPAGADANTDFGTLTLPGSAFVGFGAQFAGDAGTPRSLNWVFTPTDAINALRTTDTGVTITYEITASNSGGDDAGSIATLVINLDGVNDTPELAEVVTDGAVTEAGGTDNNTAGDVMANGSFTITDPDVGHDDFAFAGNTLEGRSGTSGAYETDGSIDGTYGTLTLNNSTGAWTYALRDDDPDTQALDVGDTAEDVFNIRLVNADGADIKRSEVVTLTIDVMGADDALVFGTNNFDPVVVTNDSRTATGTFSASDPDDEITWSATPTANGNLGTVGFVNNAWTFTLTADGVTALEGLASGATTDITFDITANDEDAGGDLTITLTGPTAVANMPPVIVTGSGIFSTGLTIEDPSNAPTDDPMAVVSTNITRFTANDPDGDNNDITWAPATPLQGSPLVATGTIDVSNVTVATLDRAYTAADFGALTVNTDGTWSFDPTDAINVLDSNDYVLLNYEIQATDDGGATDTETLTVRLNGETNAAGGLMVTDEAVRAFVVINGVEFRINTDSSATSSYEVEFNTTSADEYVAFTAPSITVYAAARDANHFSQGNIASIFNAATFNNLNVAAIILEEDTTAFTIANWDADGDTGTENEYDFSPVTSTLDRAVTEDDATDETARGFLEVTGGTGSYTYTGGTTRDIGTGTDAVRYQIFNGMYGELIVDANGNWTYTIDNAAAQALDSGPPATEMFTVIVGETGSIRTVDHVIAITVNGVDEPTPAPVFSGASEPTGTVTDTDTAFDNTPDSLMGRSILLDAVTGVISWSVDTPVVAGDTSESAAYFGELTFPSSVFVNFGTAFDRTGSGLPWQFDPTTGINDLGAGQSVTITYAVTASNAGGSAPQDLVITLMGIDDAPEITAGLTGSSASADGATGRITATDVDGDTITFADSTNADYGDLTFSRVGITDEYEWTLDLNTAGEAALDALDDGVTQDITFEITAATGGTETTTETLTIELTGTASDNLVVTNEAVRAFVIVKGVEFRVNTDSRTTPPSSYELIVNDSSGEGISPLGAGGDFAVFALTGNSHRLPANIARIFDEARLTTVGTITNVDIAAIILEEDTTVFGKPESHNFSSVNATLDVTVTEDDAADNTARGFLQVTGAADGDTYTYTGGDTTRDTTTGTYQIFEGIYGELIVDGDGNWTYVLDNTDEDTQGLDDPQEGTDRFTVTVRETGGAMRTEEAMIEIRVNGAADADPSLDVTNEAVRAFVVINGVEFRINDDSNAAPRSDYKITFTTTSNSEGASFASGQPTIKLSIDTRDTNHFSQANIARLFNEGDLTGLDVVAIILEENATTTFTHTDWDVDGNISTADAYDFSTDRDLTVTEDDAADNTAGGFLEVTGATDGDTYTYTTADFEGTYGDLTIDDNGNWAYVLNNADDDTQGLSSTDVLTDVFNVLVTQTAGTGTGRDGMETITITVNGVDELAPLDVTNEAVRAFVEINGVEFRINDDSNAAPRSDYKITFTTTSNSEGASFASGQPTIKLSIDTRDTNHFSQANIARLFNEGDLTGLDVVAIILEENATTTFTHTDWDVDGNISTADAYDFSTDRDLTVTEDDAADNTAGGFLEVTGATDGDTYTYTTADFEGTYGDLTIDDNGNWTYVLNNADDDTQRLSGNDALTDVFNVLVTQTAGTGTGRTGNETITITVNGADEELAPLVVTSQSTDTTITEDDAADTTATGTFVVTDPPAGATYTYMGTFTGTYGELTIDDANGTWTYTIDNAATATQALNSQQTRIDTITVTITESITGRSAPQTIDITVNGKDEPLTFVVDNTQTERTITDATTASDDDPDAQTGAIGLNPGSTFGFKWNVVKLADMTTLLEGRTIPANTDFGTISFPDPGGTNFVALGTPFDAALAPNFSILPLDWSFDPTDAINLLDDGESVVLTYEITAMNRGGPTTQNLVITLTGRDDAPEITGGLTGSSAGVNGATGTITATDIDGDTITFADSTNSAYGDLTFSRVGSTDEYEWTLDLNTTGEAALAALGEGDSENMTFSITATGGTEPTTETLTIELTPMLGFAAPSEVASAYMFLPAQGQIELTRGVTPVTSGLSYGVGLTEEAAKMNIEDPTHTVSNRNASPFGSFVLDDDGSWTYILTAGPSGRATNLDSNGDGAHNHGDSTDVTVWVAVKDASGPAIAQELDIQIKGATFLDGRGTPAHVPLIADPNRATSGEDEYLRGNSNVNDIIHTGEGNNAVTGLSGDDMITLGNGATANDTQIDVLYHRAQFFFDAEDVLIRSTNIDRANTIDNFIRNEDQFIFVRFVTAIVSEEVLLANADRFRLEATIQQDGNDFTLTGFRFGLTEAGGGISRGYITINYHDDHQVALTTNEVLTKYGLSRNEVTNNIDTGQIITGAEVRHNYFGDDMNDSFQILDNIPQALEGIL